MSHYTALLEDIRKFNADQSKKYQEKRYYVMMQGDSTDSLTVRDAEEPMNSNTLCVSKHLFDAMQICSALNYVANMRTVA